MVHDTHQHLSKKKTYYPTYYRALKKKKKKKLKEAKLLQAIDGKDEQELFISAEKTRLGSGREKGWSGSR